MLAIDCSKISLQTKYLMGWDWCIGIRPKNNTLALWESSLMVSMKFPWSARTCELKVMWSIEKVIIIHGSSERACRKFHLSFLQARSLWLFEYILAYNINFPADATPLSAVSSWVGWQCSPIEKPQNEMHAKSIHAYIVLSLSVSNESTRESCAVEGEFSLIFRGRCALFLAGKAPNTVVREDIVSIQSVQCGLSLVKDVLENLTIK